MELEVVWEDDVLVVVDKPAGVVVNKAESVRGATIQEWMEKKLKINSKKQKTSGGLRLVELFESRGGVVHRLDKDTSGVMVLAKTPEVLEELMGQFRRREVDKTYLALVHGLMRVGEGSLKLPLARERKDRQKFGVVLGGKLTETDYARLESYDYSDKPYKDGFSLIELRPKTGRTHQLRVVLKHLGHPIVGDGKYLGKKRAKRDKVWCKRQFLHSKELCFDHPKTGKWLRFESGLPGDLKLALMAVRRGKVDDG